MESQLRSKQQPFAAAFISCSLDQTLKSTKNSYHPHQYFITDIALIKAGYHTFDNCQQEIRLNQLYSLAISRNPAQIPIIDVGHFDKVPEGWENAKYDENIQDQIRSILCFKRGSKAQNHKCMYALQIFDEFQEQKTEEVTQPSLTDKSQIIHSYVKIQIGNMKKYINFTKKQQIQVNNLRFQPTTECLYQRVKGQLNIPGVSVLCFPQGVRVFKKQSGFKFFSFILTTDSAERFYCNSIIFSQKLSNQISQNLYDKYGIKNQRGIFSQKVFTLISQYNCTDQTNRCLQYLYRIYLSKSKEIFQQKINKLPQNFIINLETNQSKFEVQDFGLCFKINSSYPHTSTQAIYGVFKFLDIDNIVTIVENLLLERKIFFISDCQNMVGMSIEAFLSFIYPMNWIHGIINPVSNSMIQYCQAPMTITFGLSNQLAKKIKPNVDGLFVYLDHNKVYLKNNPQIKLSFHLRKQLCQRLDSFRCYDQIDVRDYLNNPQNLSLFKTQKTQDPHFDAYKIRNIFFQLTVYMLKNYKEYFTENYNKNMNQSSQRFGGIKKYYNLKEIMHFYRKDPFMCAFLQTSLFSVLIEKKKQEPNNKWIRTLDKAIRKIAGYKKQYIQQQSDNHSDNNDIQQDRLVTMFPKGCINLFGKYSQQQKQPKSSPSPRKSKQFIQESLEKPYISPSKMQGRLSLPSQYQKKSETQLQNEGARISMHKSMSNGSQKQQKQTDKGSESCGKSQSDTPQLKDDNIIVYKFQLQDEDSRQENTNNSICHIFSLPYRMVKNSVVTKWTQKKFLKLRSWKKKNSVQVDMTQPSKKQQKIQQKPQQNLQVREVKIFKQQ